MWPHRKKKNPEADKALFLATRHLEEVKQREPDVKARVAETVAIRNRNHFAESFKTLLEGGPKL